MRGERGAALKQIAPGHAGGVIAQPGGGRPARRKLGEINRAGGRSGKAEEKKCGYHRLHAGVRPSCLLEAFAYRLTARKSSILVRRTNLAQALDNTGNI